MLSMFLAALMLQATEPAPDKQASSDARVAVASAQEPEEEGARPEEELARMVCKSFAVTGSRAKRERVCMTRAEWIAHESRTRDDAGRLTNREGVCSNGAICSGS